ncbi:MAG: MarR family transcriptional regulator [Lachnospiraceae bacterium]|nr:MarR family transcriptional regulator [Lachnospiraceae bacterium]
MQEYPGRLIAITHRKTQIYWNRTLRQYDVTASEIPVFLQLYREEGITQDEIAAKQALDKSAVTRILQSMSQKGFLERHKDAGDKRCNRIFLTEKGKSLYEPIQSAREKLNARLLERMNESERNELIRLLSIAADSIQSEKENLN